MIYRILSFPFSKRPLGIFIFFFFILSFASSQEISWERIWKEEIQSEATTDSAKIIDLLQWISKRVEYETDKRYQKERSKNIRPVGENAYLDGKAVCIGYARLFESLCLAAEIPTITVEGIAFNRKDQSMENHAWNVAKYNGKWRVIDPTWASGYVQNRKYKPFFSLQYVDIPIQQREFTHYPYDPALQLRPHPLTYQQFEKKKADSDLEGLTFFSAELDSILLHYKGLTDTTALQRSLAFKPNDFFLQQLLADEYMQTAQKHIQDCIEVYSQRPSQEEVALCQKNIRQTEIWLKKSQRLYEAVKKEQSIRNSSLDINLENIKRNLNTLRQMKSFSP